MEEGKGEWEDKGQGGGEGRTSRSEVSSRAILWLGVRLLGRRGICGVLIGFLRLVGVGVGGGKREEGKKRTRRGLIWWIVV